jgi:uncharacterized membrane protein
MGQRVPWEYSVAGCAVLLGLAIWLAPAPRVAVPTAAAPPSTAQVRMVMEQRCVMCHGAAVAQKGVALHTDAQLDQHASAVYQQVVVSRQMPLNNSTGLTEEERVLVARWFEGRKQ